MLIAGTILAVLAVVMALMTIRKTTPRLRQLDNFEQKLQGYASYITSLYRGTLAIVVIVLMSDTALLMITILLILLLFLAYPNMYKIKNDLGLTDEEAAEYLGIEK